MTYVARQPPYDVSTPAGENTNIIKTKNLRTIRRACLAASRQPSVRRTAGLVTLPTSCSHLSSYLLRARPRIYRLITVSSLRTRSSKTDNTDLLGRQKTNYNKGIFNQIDEGIKLPLFSSINSLVNRLVTCTSTTFTSDQVNAGNRGDSGKTRGAQNNITSLRRPFSPSLA
jgi:hypothetical protein